MPLQQLQLLGTRQSRDVSIRIIAFVVLFLRVNEDAASKVLLVGSWGHPQDAV
jgi:hypothetical protein